MIINVKTVVLLHISVETKIHYHFSKIFLKIEMINFIQRIKLI